MIRLLAAALLLAPLGVAGAYDLAEIDGDDNPGNAPILLGWEANRFPLLFAIDPAPPTALTAAEFRQAALNSFESWRAASADAVSFQETAVPGGGALTEAILDASLAESSCSNPGDCTHLIATLTTNWAAKSGQDAATVAVTILKFDPNARRIVDADVLLNNENHQFDAAGSPARFDAEGVIVHELGHVLGIGHPRNATRSSSTMWPDTVAGDTNLRTLEADDANAVLYLYAPLTQIIPGPDNNLLGLIQRAVAAATGGGGGGCQAAPGGGDPAGLLGVLVAMALAFRRRPPRLS